MEQPSPDSNDEPEIIVLDPCAGTECTGLFQVPIPPSCECACPGPVPDCPPEKAFDGDLCECLCRDINVNCPGQADFNFDTCNCVCPLRENDCGPRERFDPNGCTCIEISSPLPPTRPQPPPGCSLEAQLDCQGYTKYLDPRTCQCKCRRFLVKKTYHNYSPRYHNYRHGRSPLYESMLDDKAVEEDRSRRSSSSSSGSRNRSQSGSKTRNGNERDEGAGNDVRSLYSLTCPAWKRADLNECVCYW